MRKGYRRIVYLILEKDGVKKVFKKIVSRYFYGRVREVDKDYF